jgi:hypothetical protein
MSAANCTLHSPGALPRRVPLDPLFIRVICGKNALTTKPQA